MTITVTHTFANATEAEAHFRLLSGSAAPARGATAEQPAVLEDATKSSAASVQPTATATATAAVVSDAQAAPETQSAVPAATDVTEQMVREEYLKYVQRGQGRTAATGKAILEQHGVPAVNGVVSLKNAKPEQLPALLNAFRTA